jgi:ketosteroid isomerase-like protein
VSAKPAAGEGDEVVKVVNAWAAAWSKKDVDGYLSFYAKDFRTPGGEARSAWEAGRRQRITAPKSISVTVESPRVSVAGEQATVTFRQGYRSDVLRSTGTKTLVMVKSAGRWQIQQEKVN